MQKMVDERVPISLIVSEYGDSLGIATMEDLVETMLGIEIVDESDSHVDMVSGPANYGSYALRRLGLI